MKKRSCKSLAEVIAKLDGLYKTTESGCVLIFRGHEDSSYAMLPGIYRNGDPDCEFESAHRIAIEHPHEFDRREHFSALAKMQHYGIGTRLLDFSFNPLVSLYLACMPTGGKDGELIVAKAETDEIKHHHSDTILCLSCLPYLRHEEKEELRRLCVRKLGNGILNEADYEKHPFVHRLYHEIRGEYPTFDFEIKAEDLLTAHFVSPNKDNERLRAQNGLFAVFGLDKDRSKKKVEDAVVERIIIPKENKGGILSTLRHMGVDDSVIYPGLERSAADINGLILVKRAIDNWK